MDEPNVVFANHNENNFANTTDSWQWFNDTQGEQGPGFDPNFPLPCAAEPNNVSYGDILNCGEDVFWVFFFAGGDELDLAVDTAHLFLVAAAPACPGDVNGDGFTDITDLGTLLANFGAGPGATLAMGDLNGDGFVNITDLGALLADFGCS